MMELKKIGALLLAASAIFMVVGCSTGPQQIETASKTEVSQMADLRKAFDSVGGDYNKLTDAQKKQFLDYSHGKQGDVDRLWASFKNPHGGNPSGHSPNGPGGG